MSSDEYHSFTETMHLMASLTNARRITEAIQELESGQGVEKALIEATRREPFMGIGDPEPLKHQWSGYWSRRINGEHHLVYKAVEDAILIAQSRYHY